MFNFRIETLPDGTEYANEEFTTREYSLNPVELLKYMEWENNIIMLDRMRQKELKEFNRNRKRKRNPFYNLGCVVGLF